MTDNNYMKHSYFERIHDRVLKEYLQMIGAVLITGPKWCGKTTTAKMQCKSIIQLQDPDKTTSYLSTADSKPSLLLQGENPRLIDEWQMAPVLWDAIRVEVDKRQENGLFILTGSTVVDDSKIMHSGTGRIARMQMYPMSLYESKESNGKISLLELFNNKEYNIDGITSNLSIENLIYAACRGGWPQAVITKNQKSALFVAKEYLENICEVDTSNIDNSKREPRKVRAILQSYARNISTLASNQTILQDVQSNFIDITSPTLYSYLNALERLFVIKNVPAWCPSIRSATAIRSSSKKEFIDPSIAIASLGLTPDLLLQDFRTFGFIFETLCIRDLNVYSTALNGKISYYHDRYNLEADCVLHINNGKYALIEFKLGNKGIEEGAAHLLKLLHLIREHNLKNVAQIREPEFLAIITGGEMAYTRKDGIKIIPIGCLKD